MKLQGLRRPVRREHAISVLRQETEAVVNFDAERDFGGEYKRQLLEKAEESFLGGTDDGSFFKGLSFLTTHSVLFPQGRDQVNALLDRFRIKDRLVSRSGSGSVLTSIFVDVGILFPELKPQLKESARKWWPPREALNRTTPSILDKYSHVFCGDLGFVFVDPEYLTKILALAPAYPSKLFSDFKKLIEQESWSIVLELGAALRLCFPDDFIVPQFTPEQWRQLIKIVKQQNGRPELGFDLAVLAAEEASLLGPKGFQITPKTPPIAEVAPLPIRPEF